MVTRHTTAAGQVRRCGPRGAIGAFVLVSCVAGCGTDSARPAPGGTASTTRDPGAPVSVQSDLSPAPTSSTESDALAAAGERTVVTRVVDGDTVDTGVGRVRLIGIDTPETVHPERGVECFGREASAFAARLMPPGTAVRLRYDAERRDRYGRLLAYVYRADDGLFVNAELVEQGYAQVSTVPPNVAHADELVMLARDARDAGRGLWSACSEDGPGSSAGASPPAVPGEGCDANYEGACVPPYPPDVDCADLGAPVRVVGADPHRLDGDGDGTGCDP